jgi:hypothetical protein
MKGPPRPELSAKRQAALKRQDGISSDRSKREVMAILAVGIDLAKNVFALHGVNQAWCPRGQ